MAGKFTRLQKTYLMDDADGVAMYLGVTQTGANRCAKPLADNAVPLGVVDSDERVDDPIRAGGSQLNKQIAVKLEGIAEIKLSGVITAGDRVILGAGGVAKVIPTDEGTYNVLGFAETDGEDGDIIAVRMAYHVFTKEATAPVYKLAFEVTDKDGDDATTATVVVKDSTNTTVTAESDGTYEVTAGTYSYTITLTGNKTATGSVTVTNANVTETVILEEE